MEEIWKDIKGYEGLYQVSNLGRVKSLDRFIIQKDRWGNDDKRLYKGKILTPKLRRGYLHIGLWKNRKRKGYTIHRLVWTTFNGDIPKGLQVNHIDEDKHNNRLDNLNLMTPKENNNWGTRNARVAAALKGRKRPLEIFEKLKRPIEAVSENGTIVYRFVSISEAVRNGFSRTAIKACVNNRYWNNKEKNIYKDLIWKYA